jgi:hypothetical protein
MGLDDRHGARRALERQHPGDGAGHREQPVDRGTVGRAPVRRHDEEAAGEEVGRGDHEGAIGHRRAQDTPFEHG